MWPFKPKTNPAIVETERVKKVKIPLTDDEAKAIEEVIVSANPDTLLQLRYTEWDRCIYLYRE